MTEFDTDARRDTGGKGLGNGECELEPIPAIIVTLNMLNEIGWCKCSECGHATPDWSNYCSNCGKAVKQ